MHKHVCGCLTFRSSDLFLLLNTPLHIVVMVSEEMKPDDSRFTKKKNVSIQRVLTILRFE